MLLIDSNDLASIESALQFAADDLQLISDAGEGSHGKTVDACLSAMHKVKDLQVDPTTLPLEVRWTTAMSRLAAVEGWDVFECGSSLFQIQRDDDDSTFTDDYDAVLHVIERARAGSDLHRRALLITIGLR